MKKIIFALLIIGSVAFAQLGPRPGGSTTIINNVSNIALNNTQLTNSGGKVSIISGFVATNGNLRGTLTVPNLPGSGGLIGLDASGNLLKTNASTSTNWLTDANGNGYGVNFFNIRDRNGISMIELYSNTTTNGGNAGIKFFSDPASPFWVNGNGVFTSKVSVSTNVSSTSANLEVGGTVGGTASALAHIGTNSLNGLTLSTNGLAEFSDGTTYRTNSQTAASITAILNNGDYWNGNISNSFQVAWKTNSVMFWKRLTP